MSARNDGGQAFPRAHTEADANSPHFKLGFDGMSLRDYFAAKALQGFCARENFTIDIDGSLLGIRRTEVCYLLADAMLAAREVRP